MLLLIKIDRDGARPDWALNRTFDLFDRLGANDKQLDFPVIYTSAKLGQSTMDLSAVEDSMTPLFKAIVEYVPSPDVDVNGTFQFQISALDLQQLCGCYRDRAHRAGDDHPKYKQFL